MADNDDSGDFLDEPFNVWIDYWAQSTSLVQLTYSGLKVLATSVEWHEVMVRADEILTRSRASRNATDEGKWDRAVLHSPGVREGAHSAEERAKAEIATGYETLHAHTLLGLWGAFERLIDDVFVVSVRHDSSILASAKLNKIKLPVDVAFGPEEDRANAVLLELRRASGAAQKFGVGQFESVLEAVGLGGPVPRSVTDTVLLAQQIRHVWAHRGGSADAKFVERCPERASVGDKLAIGVEEFDRFACCLMAYGFIILHRHYANLGKVADVVHVRGFDTIWDDLGIVDGALMSKTSAES